MQTGIDYAQRQADLDEVAAQVQAEIYAEDEEVWAREQEDRAQAELEASYCWGPR